MDGIAGITNVVALAVKIIAGVGFLFVAAIVGFFVMRRRTRMRGM